MRISFLSHGTLTEPNHRITVVGLMQGLTELGIATCYAEPTLSPRPDVVFAIHDISFEALSSNATLTAAKNLGIPIVFWVNDLESGHDHRLKHVLSLADLLATPTPLHAAALRGMCSCPTIVIEDMIDLAIGQPSKRLHKECDSPLRVLWYGYPQSYGKSMSIWHPELLRLAAESVIQYTICTLSSVYGPIHPNVNVVRYDTTTIGDTLRNHDCCVLSHAAWDYQLSTFVKSENKMTLAIAAGTPCVASRTPAYADLLERTGLSAYAVTSPSELARSLKRLNTAQERNAYLDQSWDHVVGYYSPKAVANRLLEALIPAFNLEVS